MQVQPMQCYHIFLKGLLDGTMPSLVSGDVSAHLFAVTYVPDLDVNMSLDDIKAHELSCVDYSPQSVRGCHVEARLAPNEGWFFSSDTLSFGDPITLPIFRYLVLASGLPRQNYEKKKLIAVADLAPGGAREVVNGKFEFLPSTDGWLAISSAVQS